MDSRAWAKRDMVVGLEGGDRVSVTGGWEGEIAVEREGEAK